MSTALRISRGLRRCPSPLKLGARIRPTCHLSNSRTIEEPGVNANAHSDWYYTPFTDCGLEVDVVLEAKMKERALFKYKADFTGLRHE